MSSNRKVQVYQDISDRWRWRLWGSSDVVADSGQSYANRGDAVGMASGLFPDAELEVEDCEEGDAVVSAPPPPDTGESVVKG